MSDDLRPLHRAALDDADELVRRVGPRELDRPTPCAGWDLADLLAHMIGQHLGFAAAVRQGTAPAAAFAPRPWAPDRWTESVDTLVAAFAQADLDGAAVLVEIAPAPLPMTFVVRAQLLDTVVHAWDVARALGTSYEPSAELIAAVAPAAAAVPDDGRRTRPGAAFAPTRALGGSAWKRALAQLGRDPRPATT